MNPSNTRPGTVQSADVQLVAWSWQTRTGLDVAAVTRAPDRVGVQGRVQVQWDDGPLELAYRLECEADWRFVRLDARTVYRGDARTLALAWDGRQWTDGQGPRDDLADATYIDIMATPITNTLPLCHAAWQPGVSQVFTMAYIRLPELTVEPVRQRYTWLATEADGRRRFRYETLGPAGQQQGSGTGLGGYHGQDSAFTADIVVDAGGLVISYPPYWDRMPAAQALAEAAV
ncbi:putative glycolipid-binding domain-containing protein [Cupriavidus gilardii]|uniref:putative glycolipid-binding domain-containing protein n=1 Tax=Cupriavidus gilardii TaxID=82541 RepID=UPI001ABE80A0|nr:putative glycolipid-binding domain-containing protein [Cupriavidus gilardii]MBO4123345.1 putative glycolipid-binding domain-containing protein [Cupriavidus gilardii]